MRLALGSLFFRIFLFLIFLQALQAYAFFGVPFPWFAQAGLVTICLYLAFRNHWYLPPGFLIFILFVSYAILLTFSFSIAQDYGALMPDKATTSYTFFIFLRFFQLATFGATMIIAYWLCRQRFEDQLVKSIIWIGFVICLLSLYIYAAQILGLPEPPRTRLGTGGGEQATSFSYAFHRAMGTFREPSHLAEWLVLPFFLSFSVKFRFIVLIRLLMSMIILLSGSLTGMISIAAGFAVIVFIGIQSHKEAVKGFFKIFFPLALAFFVFSIVVVTKSSQGGGATGALWKRIEPLFEDQGVKKTNRNYVYSYLDKRGVGVIGPGLGNSNLEFTKDQRLDATASFLNLYVNVAVSLGMIGVIILLAFLLQPFARLIPAVREGLEFGALFYLGAFVAWLVVYVIHSEELSVHFAILYALVSFKFEKRRRLEVSAA